MVRDIESSLPQWLSEEVYACVTKEANEKNVSPCDVIDDVLAKHYGVEGGLYKLVAHHGEGVECSGIDVSGLFD